MLCDAHNHLQDARLKPRWESLRADLQTEPIAAMVVNGTRESDWPEVLALARLDSRILPAFGYHPWFAQERGPEWKESLVRCVEAAAQLGPRRHGGIGEIGLDRWMKGADSASQEEAFRWQLRLATERNLPASIHCLRAWGQMLDILRRDPLPTRGFLLHSFGGPVEMIPELVKLGAYFSLPGSFASERKLRQRDAFLRVPLDRLLIETDAPDQLPPPDKIRHPLFDDAGDPLNSPANLRAVYEFAADLYNADIESLTTQVNANFERLFYP
jgi:TatD DNase family protein